MKHPSAPLSIAFVCDSLDHDYQHSLWTGISEACFDQGLSLTTFHGGGIVSGEEMSRFCRYMPAIIKNTPVKAVFAASSVLSNFQQKDEYIGFLKALTPLPVVSLGLKMPGFISRSCDDADGLAELLLHMIHTHQRKNFLFIRGLPDNPDSRQREEMFTRVLRDNGLAPLDANGLTGDFRQDIARKVLGQWLDSHPRSAELDAVVVANDEMAVGVMEELKSRGLEVPRAISVTGFDDMEMARYLDPPLSTVCQPIPELMRSAISLFIDGHGNSDQSADTAIRTRAVIRRSCGCFGDQESTTADDAETIELWTKALREDLTLKAEGRHFIHAMERSFVEAKNAGIPMSRWQKRLTAVRTIVVASRKTDDCTATEDILSLGGTFLLDKAEFRHTNENLKQKNRTLLIQFYTSNLSNGYTLEHITSRLGDYMLVNDVPNCRLALIDPAGNADRVRMILSMTDGQVEELPPKGKPMSLGEFTASTGESDKPDNTIIQPLFFENEMLGILSCRIEKGSSGLNDGVSAQIRTALKGVLMMEKLMAKDRSLSQANDELKQKAADLETANASIRLNQRQLLISEKMASLGRLTAGIAHEMNTPLATVRATIDELGKLVSEYVESVDNANVTAVDHKEIAADMSRSLALADKAAEKAASFIRSIKTQTRETKQAQETVFDPAAVAEEALSLLEYTARHKNVAMSFKGKDSTLRIKGNPGRFSQIVTNLVTNALDAVPRDSGKIEISIAEEDRAMALRVTDNGSGIPEHVKARIFDPLFTTKPFGEGTGLGLTLVREIVSGDFGGSISFETTEGTGTVFLVLITKTEGELHGTPKSWN